MYKITKDGRLVSRHYSFAEAKQQRSELHEADPEGRYIITAAAPGEAGDQMSLDLGDGMPSLEELRDPDGRYREHHTATLRGYIKKNPGYKIDPYNGRYGVGYILREHRIDSTQYHTATYFIRRI